MICRLAIVILPMFLLSAAAVDAEIIAPQSKPWRVGICGGWTVGYLGVLAHHGMPAERILESEITDPKKIAKYDCLITGVISRRDENMQRVLEQYVRDGGCLMSEYSPMPSQEALPGKRLKPGRVPNVRFVDAISPITEGLDYGKVIPMAGRGGASIIPEEDSGTIVIARFTYEGISAKVRERIDGHFLDEENGKHKGRGAPAILMRHIGKGIIVYSGCMIGLDLSLRGDNCAQLLVNLLQYLSKGEIHDRFYTGEVKRDRLLTTHLKQSDAYPQAAAEAVEPTGIPKDHEMLEANVGAGEDFYVYGSLSSAAEMEVLLSYQSPQRYRKVVLSEKHIELQEVVGGEASVLHSAKLARAVVSGADFVLRSRGQMVICYVAGEPVLNGCPGRPQSGAVLARGLDEAGCQPSAPVCFADDFMREEGSQNEWETVSGQWKDVVVKGKVEQGANPFKYLGISSTRALTTAGHWFWQDYSYTASVQGNGEAAGIAFYYQNENSYHFLRVSYPATAKAKTVLELVRHTDGKDVRLAEAPVALPKGEWCRLGVRASGSSIIALLDGVPVLQVHDELAGCGGIGMLSEGGSAQFDDVSVTPWQATFSSTSNQVAQWLIESGTWEDVGEGKTGGIGKAILPYGAQADSVISVPVKVGEAQAAGVYLRESDKGLYLAALVRKDGGLALRLFCADGERSEVLAEKPVPGARADEWHRLMFVARGPVLDVSVDGARIVHLAHGGPRVGRVGLYARGSSPATFDTASVEALVETEEMVDQLMPDFVGIIDRHTWAGRPGAWHPQHDELNRFWHGGYFPGPVALIIGVHPLKQKQTTTHLYLTSGQDTKVGYELVARRKWAEDVVSVTLLHEGKTVASGEVRVKPKEPYLLSLRRDEGSVWGEVNGEPIVVYNSEEARPELCQLAISNEGHHFVPEDIAVCTPWARNYTFMTAPTEWIVHCGEWEVTNRWSCSPGWTWFAGMNGNGLAESSSKLRIAGDLDLSFYVAARMMPRGDGKHYEQLRDIHVGICGGPNGAQDGYLFKVGGHRNQYTSLERKGKQVKRIPFKIPGVGIHNDWLQLGIRKRGATVQLLHWGHVLMEYTDPNPLNEGSIILGTDHNGIIIPRVTVYGRVINPPLAPLALQPG